MIELARFTAVRGETLALLASAGQAELDRRLAPGRWLVGEVFDHLLLAEKINRGELETLIELARSGEPAVLRQSFADLDVSVAYIPKALLPLLEVPFTLGNLFVPAVMRDWLMHSQLVPAQNPTIATPRPGQPAAELRADLEASIARTRELIEANADLDFRAMRHHHPLLGSNDGHGLLRFLALHKQRHQKQIREALDRCRKRRPAAPTGTPAAP